MRKWGNRFLKDGSENENGWGRVGKRRRGVSWEEAKEEQVREIVREKGLETEIKIDMRSGIRNKRTR